MKRRYFINTSLAAAVAAALPTRHAMAAALAALGKVEGDVNALTGEGAQVTLERAAVQELSDQLRGRLLLPGFEGYEQARRVLNLSIDKHPALVVQPSGASDVCAAVTFARERNLLLAVKGGGHSYGGKGTCDGGMQIDLSTLRSARVDPASKTAYIGGGSLLGELDHESALFNLVTTAGTVSHTGVGGLTLGGGFGRVARRFGLALDNVKAVDIVTADGRAQRADAANNPDLYWGVRGGGGNFGVVTSFEFGLHEMNRQVIGGSVLFPLASMRDLLNMYADYLPEAPDELYLDFVATSPLGSPDGICVIAVCYSGPPERAEQVLAPIYKAAKPIKDGITKVAYTALQRSGDSTEQRSTGQYFKSGFVNELSGAFVDTLVNGFEAMPDRGNVLILQCAGGAVSRVPVKDTAFAHRSAIATLLHGVEFPMNEGRADDFIAYGRQKWKEYEPFTDGWYANEVDKETAQMIDANYGENYDRLVQVKNQYDPTNLFRLNANVIPTV